MEKPAEGRGLLALGNPEYWATAERRLEAMTAGNSEHRPLTQRSDESGITIRGQRSGCGAIHEMVVPPLPGSEHEVREIAEIFRSGSREEAVVITGMGATEDRLKMMASAHGVVHLASHGFYLNGECESAADPGKSSRLYDQGRSYLGENPRLLSGVLFSGSNRHGEGVEEMGIDDGILTATELATIDLSGCDWLVLSACETALGEVEQGEGVFGLRRAAQLAGARTVVMSVFPVPDGETRELMTGLYSERLSGSSTVDSLQGAMREMMAESERKSGCRHPIYWGGFVAAGGWD